MTNATITANPSTTNLSLFADAARIIAKQLAGATNFNPLERKIVAYWTLATHALASLAQYPLLALFGPTNTGKSATLDVISHFAFVPSKRHLSGMSDAILRDFLASSFEGTVILEEADRGVRTDSNAYELQLSNRYSRATSKLVFNKAGETGGWSKAAINIFGATVVHRRVEFADAALSTRTITISSRPNHRRRYVRITDEGKELLAGLKIESLPEVDLPPDIGNRVLANYAPLLGMARLLGDQDFVKSIIDKLYLEQAELEYAQQSEPALLILQAIVGEVFSDPDETWCGKSIRLSTLRDRILKETGHSFQPRQIGATARRVGITVKVSNGQSVVAPDLMTLLKACEEYGYQGEDVEQLKKIIASSRQSRPKQAPTLSREGEVASLPTSSTGSLGVVGKPS